MASYNTPHAKACKMTAKGAAGGGSIKEGNGKSKVKESRADKAEDKKAGEMPGAASGGNWIAGAIKHPGALHRQLGVPQGKPIPAKKLNAAAKKGGTLGRRARLAQTLKGMH